MTAGPPGGPKGSIAARLVGATLVLGGAAAGSAAVAWWRAGRADGGLSGGGGAIGLGLLLALLLPLMAAGIFLLRHGLAPLETEEKDREWALLAAHMDPSGRLLLRDAVIALGRPQRDVVGLIAAAAAAGRVRGWFDPRAGVFQAAPLPDECCPRCGEPWTAPAEPVEPGRLAACRPCGLEFLAPSSRKS